MIKKIVFDLDNTLINWKDEYWNFGIMKACNELKITYSKEMEEKISKVIDNYEKIQEYYDIQIMQNLINKELGVNYSTDFIKTILKYFEKCIPEQIDTSITKTLEYLSNKYELVVLTNWFENQQTKRLKNSGILKYFKKVYGTEKIKLKPNKEAFTTAIGNCKPEECIMIGDNLKTDIDGAISAGMNAIFLNNKNIELDKKYKAITKLDELMQIL